MTIQPPAFDLDDVEILQRETVFQGFFRMDALRLRHRLFEGGWSREIKRELFLRGNAVAAVLYDPWQQRIGLIEQFRVGALEEPGGPWCLEVVAGMIEPDETEEQVMRRELAEEADIPRCQLEYIGNYLSSPGGSAEKLHLFCAVCALENAGGVHGLAEENEDIKLHVFDADAVFSTLYQGRFNNAATLICLQWLQINQARLNEKYSGQVFSN